MVDSFQYPDQNIRLTVDAVVFGYHSEQLHSLVSGEEAMTGLLETVYKNGQLLKEQSLQEIRLRLAQQREKQQLIQ